MRDERGDKASERRRLDPPPNMRDSIPFVHLIFDELGDKRQSVWQLGQVQHLLLGFHGKRRQQRRYCISKSSWRGVLENLSFVVVVVVVGYEVSTKKKA